MFEGDFADMYTKKTPLVVVGSVVYAQTKDQGPSSQIFSFLSLFLPEPSNLS